MKTPMVRVYPEVLKEQVDQVRGRVNADLAYSVKTNPHPALVSRAVQSGMLIEAISQEERELAIRCGARPANIIMNGPAKWWKAPSPLSVGGLFIDSIPEFEIVNKYLDDGNRLHTRFVGVRLSKSQLASRFGIDVDVREELTDAVTMLEQLVTRLGIPWAVHFHIDESLTGSESWATHGASLLRACDPLIEKLGLPAAIDYGGGWHINDLDLLEDSIFDVDPPWAEHVGYKVLELGKSVLEPCAELFTSVIVGLNRSGDVVVDAGIADAPETPYWPHPVYILKDGMKTRLPKGDGRILGRTCMEADILAQNIDTSDLSVNDLLVFGRVGGYDSSIRYPFGRGESRAQA